MAKKKKKEWKKYTKALFQYILENNVNAVKHILEKIDDDAMTKKMMLQLDDEGFCPIHVASGLNHSEIVEILLKQHDKENVSPAVNRQPGFRREDSHNNTSL